MKHETVKFNFNIWNMPAPKYTVQCMAVALLILTLAVTETPMFL